MPRERVRGPKNKKQLSPIEKQHLDQLTNFGCGSAAYIRTFTRRQIRSLYPGMRLPRAPKGTTHEVFYATCRAENSFPIAICDDFNAARVYALEDDREALCAH